mgnify:CR=1 FL=1
MYKGGHVRLRETMLGERFNDELNTLTSSKKGFKKQK